MKYVTIVVEDTAEPIHLGMALAGGRVTAAGIGDYSLYCDLMEAAKDLVLLIEDGALTRDAVLEASAQKVRDLITALDDTGDGLNSEHGALRIDAKRYRYMRDFPYNNSARAVGITDGRHFWLQYAAADQAVDKAMYDDAELLACMAQEHGQ
ncbi:hypothetical protein [Pseudomonas kurunegalensis]|uniref:hypothetical protein n=1 Tax=Pseudomonas kurunegalensis TaxID=485880 RepID=UPI00257116DC|nr:hypothetical protein [Pseudomonas kurunegalensis]WJD60610.1 hypothetical protein QQ992_16870 [Pseudomonas kurunegalensis]